MAELISTRERVKRLLSKGMSKAAVARELGVAKATVIYHASRLDKKSTTNVEWKGDWEAVQAEYDTGKSLKSLVREGLITRSAWYRGVSSGLLVPRDRSALELEQIFKITHRRPHSREVLMIKRSGAVGDMCNECGQGEIWNGRELVLHLDHIDGNPNNNSLKNLRLLCPNCHTQTPTYGRRRRSK